MISVKNKSTISDKQQAFVNIYCSNGHNAFKAYKAAYPDSSERASQSNSTRLMENDKIRDAIFKIEAKIVEKQEYDLKQAMFEINNLISGLTKQADAGNISAKSLLLQAIKEKNDITGLHKQIFIDKTPQQRELDESQKALADEFIAFKQRQRLKGA